MARCGRGVLAAAAAVLALSSCAPALAEVGQRQGVRVSVQGKMSPVRLPRRGAAPVAVSFAGRITSVLPAGPPQLLGLTIAINRHGRLDARGLPRCRLGQIDPSTSVEALAACRASLVGAGSFSADLRIPEQSPVPSSGRILAFNGRLRGRPVIFAHIYGTEPVPTSYVLPFSIARSAGTYGTILEALLPQVTGDWGFVTGISLSLGRNFSSHGQRRSYLSADCPAPAGFSGAVFPLAETTFAFDDGLTLRSTLNRGCKVRR